VHVALDHRRVQPVHRILLIDKRDRASFKLRDQLLEGLTHAVAALAEPLRAGFVIVVFGPQAVTQQFRSNT
jgi:hypothetical protein